MNGSNERSPLLEICERLRLSGTAHRGTAASRDMAGINGASLASRRTCFICLIASMLAGMTPAAAVAATYTWGGGGTGWGTSTNWSGSPSLVWSNTTDVVLYAPGGVNYNQNIGGAKTIRSLTLNASADNNLTLFLNNNNTSPTAAFDLTFDTNASSGTASIAVDSGAAANFTISNSGSFNGNVVLADHLLVDHNGSGLLDIARPITGAFNLLKSGTGVLQLSGANTYSGTTSINAGTLRVVTGGNLSATSVIADGAVLEINSSGTVSAGTISGAGSIVKNGSGTMGFGAQTFSGGLTLNAGGLDFASSAALGTGTFTVNGGAFGATGGANRNLSNPIVFGGNATFGSAGSNGTIRVTRYSGNVDLGGGTRTLTVSQTTELNGTISNGGLTIAGNGSYTLTLGGSNSFTGPTTVTSGTLILNNANALAGSTFGGGAGSLSFGPLTTATFGGMSGSTNLVLGNASSAAVALSVGTNGGSNTYSGAFSGAGSLVKVGTGTFTLTGANTYAGDTTVSTGILAVGAPGGLSDSTAVTVNGGGLNMSTFADTVASLTITSGSVFGSGTLTAATYYIGGGVTAANLGAGTLNVTGNSTLSGVAGAATVNLNAGTLTLSSGGRLSSAAAVSGSSGAAIALGGNETIGSLVGAANVSLGSNTLTVGNSTNSTYSGAFSGAGSLAKVGSGTFTLTGSSSIGGSTAVNVGTLLVNGWLLGNSMSVASVATLGGSGRVGGTVTVNGFLSPGNSPGLLSIGSLVLGGSSTTLLEITGPLRGSQYDSLDITDGGLVYGGALTLDFGQTFPDQTTFLAFGLTGTGGRSGSFTSVTALGAYGSLTFTNNGLGVWTTGATTNVPSQHLQFTEATGEVIVVPEPATTAALAAAIGVAWLCRRRPAPGQRAGEV